MNYPTRLISAKLLSPVFRQAILSRPRLNTRLNEINDYILTAIVAPGGYGKTTLLKDWIDQSGYAYSWYNIDSSDNDAFVFFRYLLKCMRKHHIEFGQMTEDILQQSHPLPEDLFNSFISDLNQFTTSRYRPGKIVLILDNVHFLSSSGVLDCLDKLIDYAPAYLHFVFIANQRPDLGLSARLIRCEARILDIHELAFTPSEVAQFIELRLGKTLSANEASQLTDITHGWVALLQLCVLQGDKLLMTADAHISSLANKSPIETPAQSDLSVETRRAFSEFLVEEVVSNWSVQQKLLYPQLALLPNFSLALINLLFAEEDAHYLTQDIADSPFFQITSGKTDSIWYEIHPLIKGWLTQNQIASIPTERRQLLMEKAASWYQEQQLYVDAIELFLKQKDEEHAARLLSEIMESLLHSGQEDLFNRLMDTISDAIKTKYIKLNIGKAVLLFRKNRLPQAAQLLNEVKKALSGKHQSCPDHLFQSGFGDANDLQQCLVLIDIIDSFILRAQGQNRQALEICQSLLTSIEPEQSGINWIYLGLAADYYHMGEINKAIDYAYQGVATAKQAKEIGPMTYCLAWLLHGLMENGKVKLAKQIYQDEMLWLKQHLPESSRHFYRLYGVGTQIFIETNQLDQAQVCFEQSHHLETGAWKEDIVYYRYMTGVALAFAQRNQEKAQMLLSEMALFYRSHFDTPWNLVIPSPAWLQALVDFSASPSADKAAKYGKKPQEEDYLSELAYHNDLSIFYGIQSIYAPQYNEALARIQSWAEQRGATTLALRVLLARSRIAFLHQQHASAETLLFTALKLARTGGYLGTLLAEGPMLIAGLQLAIKKQVEVDYCHYLINELTKSSTRHHSCEPKGAPESLSQREMDVFKLLADGLANPQIAERLGITDNTVKSHLKNIYSKLGVRNRTQAIAIQHSYHDD